MKYTIQTESLGLLKEALASRCDGIRFGPEFCEWKLPALDVLKRAHEDVKGAGKSFAYVTPILSNNGVNKLRGQLAFLKDVDDAQIIIGDIGALNLLKDYKELQLRLGRPRVYIPARCPWSQITRMPDPSFLTRFNMEKIFYQTSLNYVRTLDYYKSLGVLGADIDWIKKGFPHYRKIIKNGFSLSVHTCAVPIAVTMRCHMARFLGEGEPALCSKPCLSKAFVIKQETVQRAFVLHGNVVYRLVESPQRDVKQLQRLGVEEIIISMGPVSKIMTTKDVDETIAALSGGV